ncbi:hypothetical protein ALC62_04153 [Cyphomyrmex costatus]|uniref:THAP-type domain-containing protein n=1 Tax=Cyphomyrmex costatus TaxID=456900 RepID=A0A151K270_9HYME|nr:hypothetical protein ALC62_04153 [Cyphomyrmex costatus]
MSFRCSVPKCTNSNKDGYCCVTFAQDPELRRKWIDAVGIADWEPSKTAVLCEVSYWAHSAEKSATRALAVIGIFF